VSRTGVARTAASLLVVASAACAAGGRSAQAPSAASPLPAPAMSMGDLQGRPLLGDLPARAQRLGAGTPALVASSEALDNGWVGGFVDVPREDCLLGYARGSASIDDVDVAIYSEDGTTLAVDEGRDVHPTVLMCPPHPDRVYVTAHVVEGEGLVAVGAQLVPKDRAIIVARALGARGVVGQGPRPADGWPGLEEAVRTRREELGGQWQELRRVALAVDARMPTVLALPVEAGLCVDAIVVPDEDVALLDVEAFDDAGRSLGRAKDGPGPRALVVCSTLQSAGTLALRPHIGRGLAAVVLARSTGSPDRASTPPADALWVGTSQPIARAGAAHEAALAKDGYGAATTTASGSLALARRVSLPLDLGAAGASPGGCRRVDVVAGSPLALVDAWIWSDAGALLSSGGSSSSLTLFACARGPARLELQTRGRPGPYAITTRPERWRGPALAAHPLAGARMLARAAAGPDAVFEGKEAALREAALDAEHVVAWPETIAPGSCLHATIGVQGEGAGVEARVVDTEGAEVDRAEGAHAATVRACAAADAARAVRIEMRASAGRLDAVVGERTTSAL
jgi:hypothetical protein